MRLIITGPRGKMGRQITKIAMEHADITLVGATAPEGRDYIGRDVGQVAAVGADAGVMVSSRMEDIIAGCDVIVDFTTPEYSLEVVSLAAAYGKAVVCGTTGFSAEQMQIIRQAGAKIPVLYAANTSRVVQLMQKLLELAAAELGDDADVEIIEMHDRWKEDAPSGTAKEFGTIIAGARGQQPETPAVYGRAGRKRREPGEIGYHSIRSGNISSSHSVIFGGLGERLEITHHAYDFECFARGACEAALSLSRKGAGYYTLKDL